MKQMKQEEDLNKNLIKNELTLSSLVTKTITLFPRFPKKN